ncbi:hypothetical protein CTT34_09680 [Vreelandella aquamarina]|uniref:Polypeptide-transport-associated ShlB-type domain-containing protein n=2 Tax=Vreelandella aquamarina TaxID=77097 RepID=A0A857GN45_9GAMM|nr:hypothetical protein CTT34_09680 [Halomonas meridiana]
MVNGLMAHEDTSYIDTVFAADEHPSRPSPLFRNVSQYGLGWMAALVLGGIVYTLSAQAQIATDSGDLYRIVQEEVSLTVLSLDASPQAFLQGGDLQTVFQRIEIEGASLISPGELTHHLASWLNQPLGLEQIHAAAKTLDGVYRSRGWRARTRLVKQDLYSGTLRLRIIEEGRGRQQLAVLDSDDSSYPNTPLK